MKFYQATNPVEYQEIFYQEIGLERVDVSLEESIWQKKEIGYIHSFGTMYEMQCGIGSYTIPEDFLVEFQYPTTYLHFGIIYEGITYSLVENRLEEMCQPSVFAAVERAAGGVNCWKSGQAFQGVEISIEYEYLKTSLLPFLGLSPEALDFLSENTRYTYLPEEMKALILKMESLLKARRMTHALLVSIGLEFVALLLHPDNQVYFSHSNECFSQFVQIGKRRIRLTQGDYNKIVNAYEWLTENAHSFVSIHELSKMLAISEQKLKAGFQALYQQTIWNYANSIRMNRAVALLKDTNYTAKDITEQIGYRSQAAFIQVFKKWSGMTPGQFREQVQSMKE